MDDFSSYIGLLVIAIGCIISVISDARKDRRKSDGTQRSLLQRISDLVGDKEESAPSRREYHRTYVREERPESLREDEGVKPSCRPASFLEGEKTFEPLQTVADPPSTESMADNAHGTPTRQEIRQAVIWSEILKTKF